jgi:hypothetical protein
MGQRDAEIESAMADTEQEIDQLRGGSTGKAADRWRRFPIR